MPANRVLLSIVGLQVALALLVAVLFLVVDGPVAACSAALGGAIAVVPGAFYAWRLIRSRSACAKALLRVHYTAELGKLALTFVLFGATFAWARGVSAGPLFAAYIAALMVYWAALVIFNRA